MMSYNPQAISYGHVLSYGHVRHSSSPLLPSSHLIPEFFACFTLTPSPHPSFRPPTCRPLSPLSSSPLFWLVAVAAEIARPGARPRVRSLLERGIAAIERHTGTHSVLMWRLYIAYEMEVVGGKERARRIFFRAIHACPW